MSLSIKTRKRIRTVIIFTVVGLILGPVFTIFSFGFVIVSIFKGLIVGFLITFLIGVFENFIFQDNFNRLRFSIALLIRTGVYIIVISFSVIVVWVIHESYANGVTIDDTIAGNDFRFFILQGDFRNIFIFSIIVSFLINFLTQINSLLGKNVLLNYLTGRYHKPKEERRAFMFLDLSSSTTIAEKLDPVLFHKFMSNYFFDIDEAITESNGEIYQYVGDEVVISWKGDSGFYNADCIKCFFNISKKINSLSYKYEKDFGTIPGFKAGLHCGKVVTGEVGDSKREIVFHGDVLNTASRIQAQCNSLRKKFLVSEDVMQNINLPSEYKSESLGEFMLRGKSLGVEIYSVEII